MKACCWVCNDAPFPGSPLCLLGVEGIAFSSLPERDLSANDTLRDFFLFAAVFAGAAWSPNENMTHPLLWVWVALQSSRCARDETSSGVARRDRKKCPLAHFYSPFLAPL